METHHFSEKTSLTTLVEMDIQNQSEAIFQFATEGILIIDKQGNIIRVNPNGEALFGYKNGELEGKTVEDLIPNRFHTNHVKQRDSFNTHPHARSMGVGRDLFAVRKDGSEFPVEVSLSPYKHSKGDYVIAFVIDITVRKVAENKLINYKNELEKEVEERTLVLKGAIQKLEKTKAELDESLKRERELSSMKSRFISIASHEFRTPLATVLSSLSLVEKYANLAENEKRDKHLTRIKSSVRNLTEILNDFLSLNKLEEGKVFVSLETYKLNELLEEISQQMQSIAKKGQKINVEWVNKPTNFEVRLDPKLFNNIIINLVSNAIKFSPENSEIKITGEFTAGGEPHNQVVIKVKDNGIGMPESEQKHVFERFYRMRNAGEIQGTGLGLSIVNHYVSLLKGKITFSSQENKGTEFVLYLQRYISL